MFSTRLFIGYFCLVLYTQSSYVLADDTTQYSNYPNNTKLTWDQANDFCRKNNLTLPFTLNREDHNELKQYIKDTGLEPDPEAPGFWMGGRLDGTLRRWDFGSKSILFNGWHVDEVDQKWDEKKTCMEIMNVKHKFKSDGLGWRTARCDEKRAVICQSYE